MENSAKNTSEAPRSTLDSSVDDIDYLLDQIRIETEKEGSIEAEGTSSHGNSSQSFPVNGSSNQHQPVLESDYDYRTGVHNPPLQPMPPYPRSSQTDYNLNNGDFGVDGSMPYSAWPNQNTPSMDMASTPYSASQRDPFNGLSSLSSLAYQNGVNNSPIWGVVDNSMQTNLPMNNDFAGESSQFFKFAATWARADNLMQKNLNDGLASVSQINQCAATERNEPFSINESNTSSGIFGCPRNQKSYKIGVQDGIQFGQVDIVQKAMNEQESTQSQEILSRKNEVMTNMIFEKTLEGMLLIMNDVNGKFFFSRLIDTCNPIQLSMILAKITSRAKDLFETSCHEDGAQSIQWLIKVLKGSTLIAEVTSALSRILYHLMTDKIGAYAIFNCFEVFTSQQNEVLHKELIAHCINLATHKIGWVFLKRSIRHIDGDLRYQLLQKISDNAALLAYDSQGNFIVRSVIEIGDPVFTPRICSLLKGQYVALSSNWGGSHVVQKCLTSGCPEMIFAVQELLKYEELEEVVKHRNGNYVIQSALRETKRIGSPLFLELRIKILSYEKLMMDMERNLSDTFNEVVQWTSEHELVRMNKSLYAICHLSLLMLLKYLR